MKELLDSMKVTLEDVTVDIDKFISGNNAAAGRVRKRMMKIKKMAQEMRVRVQEEKNNRKGGGKSMGKKAVKKGKKEVVVEEKKAGRGRPKKQQ